jgi:hypothetical protein
LCKKGKDYQRTFEQIHFQNAEHFVFIKLSNANELQNIIPTLSGSDTVYYLVNVSSDLSQLYTLIDIKNPWAFMVEIDKAVDLKIVSELVKNKIHPAGMRSFVYDEAKIVSVAKAQRYFGTGYDVISSNSGENIVQVHKIVNQNRKVDPP